MYRTAKSTRMLGFAATTAMAAALLTGCTTASAPAANLSASRAEAALADGKHAQAIEHAEAAVLADPHNAAYRAVLGSAYLDAGRFSSAATSFDDAMQLGDTSARTALSLALAQIGEGKGNDAVALINKYEQDLPAADAGLALALAGRPDRGVFLMSNAIRSGQNTAKMRQNLAYAYALSGHWREARVMAEQDVPADKVGDRIAEWAEMTQPEAWQVRVAALLDVPAGVRDAGQPSQLALVNNPSIEQLAAEANARSVDELPPVAIAAAPSGELPALSAVDPSRDLDVQDAPVAAPPATFANAFANSAPMLQAVPAPQASASFAANAAPAALGTHLIQLGSFASEAGARRAWSIYAQRYPQLAGHQMVISEAVVKGKHYWRVSAGGFDRAGSSAMCGRVRGGGQGCIAYAEGRPLPGAVANGVQMARRD
jgi:Flp pilus assembly protein TadD